VVVGAIRRLVVACSDEDTNVQKTCHLLLANSDDEEPRAAPALACRFQACSDMVTGKTSGPAARRLATVHVETRQAARRPGKGETMLERTLGCEKEQHTETMINSKVPQLDSSAIRPVSAAKHNKMPQGCGLL
jgi:hypothetical protein